MKVYSVNRDYEDFLVIEDEGTVVDLTRAEIFYGQAHGEAADEQVVDVEELIWDGRFTIDHLGGIMAHVRREGLVRELAVDLNTVSINAPLYPGKIIALGNNYFKHVQEMNQALPEEPVLFGKWPSAVIGPGEPIVKPSWIGRMDYEAELAFIVGKTAKNVPKERAMEYVAGYTCLNDVTARELQARDMARKLPWMPSKNFDTFCPLGPCILLAGAVDTPVSIDVSSRVNGELKQSGNTTDFIFDIPTVIAYITKIMTLEPGDVVTTGTPVGVGPLEPGDTVEVACSGIGMLSNPVTAGK
jgi:2-keto-4-pentenoate hydratase/2-oxohepta-3-ene-1,7-dioic acid hydratase in catechol pathway